MNLSTPTRALLFLATLTAVAQDGPQPTQPVPSAPATATIARPRPRLPRARKPDELSYNMNLIVLDPAHGGADKGAKLGDNAFENDATVALANRLKPLLEAKGFTVVQTHAAATDDMSADQRVEIANRGRALACVILHVSNAGHGIHLYTSALAQAQASQAADDQQIKPWDTAQAVVEAQSLRLSNDFAAAVNGLRIPLVVGKSSIKPIDSLSCPAIALELSPLSQRDQAGTAVLDASYQARVADSIANALVFWRGQVLSSAAAAQAAKAALTPAPATAPPVPKAKPKPNPPNTPGIPAPDRVPAAKPAPVVRRPPEAAPAGPPQ